MSFVSTAGAVISTGQSYRAPALRSSAITDYRGRIRTYSAIYRSQPNLRTVVNFLARHSAALTLNLYERVSDTERAYRRDHPLDALLRIPHPRMGRHLWLLTMVSDLGVFDNAVALKVITEDGIALQPFPPGWVTPKGDNIFDAERYLIRNPRSAGPGVEYGFDEVVHLKGYNPDDDRSWGVSPIETLRTILDEDLASSQYRAQLWRRGARVTGVIERPVDAPAWKPSARERFRESWRGAWTMDDGEGGSAGGTPILEEGMTFKPHAFTAQEAEYLGARKLTRAEVRAAYHLHPDESSTTAAATEARRNLYVDALGPLLDQITDAITVSLFPDFGLDPSAFYIEANLDAKLAGSFTERAEVMSRAVGAPWLTRNEARAKDNLPPVEGGDELVTPLNVLIGGRANPADTAPGTPGAGQVGTAALATLPRALDPIEAKATDATIELPAGYPAELDSWVAQHEATLTAFVERQRRSVMSRLGAGMLPEEALDLDRWVGELTADLGGLALAMAPDAAAPVAERFGIDYNLDAAEAWLLNNARIVAEGFNAVTAEAIAAAYGTPVLLARDVLGKADVDVDNPPTPLDLAADVFAWSAAGRSSTTAVSRVCTVANFARQDAASQSGAGVKRWVVTSSNPRASHAAIDGEEVPIGETFSNGLQWPGDPLGDAMEVANCRCLVEFDAT